METENNGLAAFKVNCLFLFCFGFFKTEIQVTLTLCQSRMNVTSQNLHFAVFCLDFMLYLHLCLLWLGALLRNNHSDCYAGGFMGKQLWILSIADIIQLNCVNSLLKLIQAVTHWPCCTLYVSTQFPFSLANTLTSRQELPHTERERVPSIIVSDFCAKLQLCQTISDTITHIHLCTPLSTAVG